MRRRDGWTVVMLAIVAVGVAATERNDNTAVLKGTAASGNGTIWPVSRQATVR